MDREYYLVGGAVRDLLIPRESHDLDFVVTGDPFQAARRVADKLGGAYYPLDEENGTARVILPGSHFRNIHLDFSNIRGSDLTEDLRSRDFTINSMAMSIKDFNKLIDPLSGAKDLKNKKLRVCSPEAILHDPIRLVRGVRLSIDLNLEILPDTKELMRQSVAKLEKISPERKRDEIFRMLEGPKPDSTIRILDRLGALIYLLPELDSLKGLTQSVPHVSDVWDHTLNGLAFLKAIVKEFTQDHVLDSNNNFQLGLVSVSLNEFRDQIRSHFDYSLNPERSHQALLYLGYLYHDIGKAECRTIDEDGKIRFFNHEEAGSKIIAERAVNLRLSNHEINRLIWIVQGHMRPLLFVQQEQTPSPKAIYRFFRKYGKAGIDICFAALADTLGTYGPTLPHETWIKTLQITQSLFAAWWIKPLEQVRPPSLVNGHDILELFGLQPGPQIGELLEAVREAQVEEKIFTREEALDLIAELVKKSK